MTDRDERIEATLQVLTLMVQKLYAQEFEDKPQQLEPCRVEVQQDLQYQWHKLSRGSREQIDFMSRVQPKAEAEVIRMFGEVKRLIAARAPKAP
ncbi:hypothetical protein ACM792_14720 [Metapseudomonas otitidis]|uniref:hypothetical protein n=1 Tax=Metapseudomonas otitidis TaxID=319939 RepID=UPI0039FD84FA